MEARISVSANRAKVVTIDCDYVYSRFAAAYLLVHGDEVAFIDNNTAHAVPKLIASLKAEGFAPEQVKYVIITHVHLDHAGGTSQLMRACPQAKLLAHPRAAKHMIDPSKLVGSAKVVYGEADFKKLYGEIHPVAKDRVQEVGDGEVLALGGARLRFIHTRGHANHHFCIYDERLGIIFTGDAFGLSYPDLQKYGRFILPSTSPTDFDAAEAKKSIAKVIETGSEKAYLTHFGEVEKLSACALQLNQYLNFSRELVERAVTSALVNEALPQFCESELRKFLAEDLNLRKFSFSASELGILNMDLKLNGAGLAFVATKLRMTHAKGTP